MGRNVQRAMIKPGEEYVKRWISKNSITHKESEADRGNGNTAVWGSQPAGKNEVTRQTSGTKTKGYINNQQNQTNTKWMKDRGPTPTPTTQRKIQKGQKSQTPKNQKSQKNTR